MLKFILSLALLMTALVFAAPQKLIQEVKIPALELREGQPEGAFPAVLAPHFVSAEHARIAPDSLVIGCAKAGTTHAYALGLLEAHEAVNDTLAGMPVVIAYCSLCDSAVAYDRRTADGTFTFAVSGWLWRNAQTLRDQETGSLWSHLTGEALSGARKGTSLRPFDGSIARVRWSVWKRQHPETRVLSVDGVEDIPFDRFADYRHDPRKSGYYPPPYLDPRLPPKEKVVGITVGSLARAYRLSPLLRTPLLSATVNDRRLLLYRNPRSGAVAVWESPAGDAPVSGERLFGETIQGAQGQCWRASDGVALVPGVTDLKPYPYRFTYWFAWSSHYPATDIFDSESDKRETAQ
jgi:hypothetical protein